MSKTSLREKDVEKWLSFHYRLAHHPTCDNFSEHFYRLFGKKVCRGCVMMYSGLITGLFILILAQFYLWGSEPYLNFFLVYAFFLPTVYSAYFKPRRWIRDIFRFFLGFTYTQAIISVYLSFTSGIWWAAILVIGTYIWGSTKLSGQRVVSNNKVCLACPEVNDRHCSGLKQYTERKSIIEGVKFRFDTFAE